MTLASSSNASAQDSRPWTMSLSLMIVTGSRPESNRAVSVRRYARSPSFSRRLISADAAHQVDLADADLARVFGGGQLKSTLRTALITLCGSRRKA